MSRIRVLDCTLRDGGYCNQWMFGFKNIKRIISGLIEANIDIIECGFLTNKVIYKKDISKFTSMDEIATLIPSNRENKLYVCLMNYGEYKIEDIPEYDGSSLDGIRLAFHKKDMIDALEHCKEIKAKGYKVFIQAMVSLNYTDEEFLNLIRCVNVLEPYAFYIVDSFGVMKRKDLIRLFYMVEHNLKENIYIGYHSHNNVQLAYSNAQALTDIQTKRSIIIDSSIFGMGRGAGNLNTELFIEYLNDNLNSSYSVKPILQIIDEVINNFYLTNYWGYSLPHYLSATNNCHPNYASYLDDMKKLTVENMHEILFMMDDDKRSSYDKNYIEELYIRYMSAGKTFETNLTELKNRINGKTVLIIAPGKSVEYEKEKIIDYACNNSIISISINFDYQYYNTDYIFLSNIRRFKELDIKKRNKTIVTSNIPADGVFLRTKYAELLNNISAVKDNAGMMVIKFLIDLGVKKILIAGIDGYSHDSSQNYVDDDMTFISKNSVYDAMNLGMLNVLQEYSRKVEISYLTTPHFIRIYNQ